MILEHAVHPPRCYSLSHRIAPWHSAAHAAQGTRRRGFRSISDGQGGGPRRTRGASLAPSRLEDVAAKRAKAKSDLLLMFLLNARRPDKFRPTVKVRHEHSIVDRLGAALARMHAIETTAVEGIEVCQGGEQCVTDRGH